MGIKRKETNEMKAKIKITDIAWDIDYGDDTKLPSEVEVNISEVYPNLAEDISDWLSNEYGYCHEGFAFDIEKGE